MTCPKRPLDIQDPDYEGIAPQETKRLRLLEENAKAEVSQQVLGIIQRQFSMEISNREKEINEIQQRLYEARKSLHMLRYVIVSNFYDKNKQIQSVTEEKQKRIHPAVKKLIGKEPSSWEPLNQRPSKYRQLTSTETKEETKEDVKESSVVVNKIPRYIPPKGSDEQVFHNNSSRGSHHKVKKRIVVGNISKWIPLDTRDDAASHKWMMYVRGPKEAPDVSNFVLKVRFFLHPSYRPHDIAEVTSPPFHLSRRGWGEFPVRVQIHFCNEINKPVDLIHQLKLDKTYTGLQTLGAETVVDVWLYTRSISSLPTYENEDSESIGVENTNKDFSEHPLFQNKYENIKEEPRTSFNEIQHSIENSQTHTKVSVENHVTVCDAFSDQNSEFSSRIKVEKLEDNPAQSCIETNLDSQLISKQNFSEVVSIVPHNLDHDYFGSIIYKPENFQVKRNKPQQSLLKKHNNCNIRGSEVLNPSGTELGKPVDKTASLIQFTDHVKSTNNIQSPQGSSSSTDSKSNEKYSWLNLETNSSTPEDNSLGQQYKPMSEPPSLNSSSERLQEVTYQNTSVTDVTNRSSNLNNCDSASQKVCYNSLSEGAVVSDNNVLQKQTTNNKIVTTKLTTLVRCVDTSGNVFFVTLGGENTLNNSPLTVNKVNLTKNHPVMIVKNGQLMLVKPSQKSQESQLVKTDIKLNKGGNSILKKNVILAKSEESKQVFRKTLILNKANSKLDTQVTKIDYKERLRAAVKSCCFNDIALALRPLLRYMPLVSSKASDPEYKIVHPYAAPNEATFLSWNIGKRKAAEWVRAKAVQRILAEHFPAESLWSTHSIAVWAKMHGHTPVPSSVNIKNKQVKAEVISHDTYTEAVGVMDWLIGCNPTTDVETDVDVESLGSPSTQVIKKIDTSSTLDKTNKPIELWGLMRGEELCMFVRESVRQLGIKLESEEVVPGALYCVTERLLLEAMLSLVDDLLRRSLCQAWKRNYNKYPDRITMNDVKMAIMSRNELDIFTNRDMGVQITQIADADTS